MTKETAKKGASILREIESVEYFIKRAEDYIPKPDFNCGMNIEIEEEIIRIWDSSHKSKIKALKNLLAKKNNDLKNLK
jgi:hypothetical protein